MPIFELAFTLFTAIANILLGIVVFVRNPKAGRSKSFLIFTMSLAFWVVTNYLTDRAPTYTGKLLSAHLAYVGAYLAILTLYIFFHNFNNLQKIRRKSFYIYLALAVVGSAISVSNLVASGIVVKANGTDINTGILYYPYLLSLLYMFTAALLYIFKVRKRSGTIPAEKTQISFILFGVTAGFILGFLLNGVLPLLIDSFQISKYGPIFTLFMTGSITIAIVKHRLFDIRLVVARSLAYVSSILIVGVTYGFFAFRLVSVFFSSASLQVQQAMDVVLAIILAFTFAPLLRFFGRVSNRIFYRDKYDPQELVNSVGRVMASEIHLEALSKKIEQIIENQMKVSATDIVVFQDKQIYFQTHRLAHNEHDQIKSDLRKLGRLLVVADDLTGGERKEIMQRYGVSVSLALRTSEEFIGYLLLGEKKSGDIYSDEDLRTLKIIANELSVAIQNAKAFAEIEQFNVTLQEKVDKATKNLRHANDQLKELDQAKDEFISMASHQLRTPLTTVKGYASMLAEGDFGKLNKEQEEPVKEALDGASRMARLIDDLLNVSRMEAGRFFIDAQPTDVVKMTQQEVDQLQSLATSKKVELKYDPPKSPIKPVTLDENKTRQVIMNLVDNAIHYSQPPAGGGHVHVKLAVEGDNLVFTVQDDGIGVSKEFQPKLFQKMNRSEAAKKVRPDGTGLGLYLVKRVVEDQGGQIIFQSVEHKGSTFGFRLPLSGVPKELLGKAQAIAKTAHLSA